MIPEAVLKAFDLDRYRQIKPITNGLINHSYEIINEKKRAFFLQKLNTNIFKQPDDIQNNYSCIRQHLLLKNSFKLPAVILTTDNLPLFISNTETWRCFEFVPGAYSNTTAENASKAYEVANCFGRFTADLADLNPSQIKTILPDFHDPAFRFSQFQTAVKNADPHLKKEAEVLINNVLSKTYLINWFRKIEKNSVSYRKHILHHDCKISNILFQKDTGTLLFPIDLDTTQPGLFFSDIGDMIRSMVPNHDEDFVKINELQLRTEFYQSITQGYLDAMGIYLSESERRDIHLAGPIVIYMQALRFLTDFLNNNIYYRVSYSSQNKDRAANQIYILELLEKYLQLK